MILSHDFLNVTIKGVTFRSAPNTKAARDFFLDSAALVGWDDGVGARRQVTQRPVTNGDFPDIATMAARSLTLTGTARANTPQDLHAMRDQLMGLLSDGQYTQIAVQNSAGTRYATVGQDNTPSWVQHADTFASFKLDLFQPDPRIYGEQHMISIYGAPTAAAGLDYTLTYPLDYHTAVSQQTQYIFNNGNADAWPVFTVAGNFYGGFTITDNLGHKITYMGDASLYASVVIDTAAGTATQGGQDRSTLLTSRDWFSVPAGGSIQPSFNPVNGATGWCDIIYRDTWL